MSTKSVIYCDCCGAQMTTFDSDGESIHVGLKVDQRFTICQTKKTVSGSSYIPIFDSYGSDFCSFRCMKLMLAKLLQALEGE